jgi:thiosulfate/3-mercaptopyruvate sulfurtransferase
MTFLTIALTIAALTPASRLVSDVAPGASLVSSSSPSSAHSDVADDSLVVTPAWVEAHLSDPNVVVIEVVDSLGKRGDRIPGSRELWYRHMVVRRDSLSTELPSTDSLKSLFEGLGISDGTRVVVYAQQAPMATRLIMTLTYIGHERVSYLDGGLPQWIMEKHALTQQDGPPTRGAITVRSRPGMIVNASWISSRLSTPTLRLIDTRTLGEYNGTGNRSGMPSAGHLAGARNLEWEWLFREDQPLKLKDRAALLKLYGENVAPTDQVVTYCWVGYRASATWFAAKVLGFDAKFYDGSYQDWQQRKLPVTAGGAR